MWLKTWNKVKWLPNYWKFLSTSRVFFWDKRLHRYAIVSLAFFYRIFLKYTFKIGDMFVVKDPIPCGLCMHVVYKFLCLGCNACYVRETFWHLFTHVHEHLVSDRTSHIFRHYTILHNVALFVLMSVLTS